MSRIGTLTLLALSTVGAALAGCGRAGGLDQPPPLFGERARAAYYAERSDRAQAGAAASQDRNAPGSAERAAANTVANSTDSDDNAPLTTRDIKDPDQQLTSPRNSPAPGAPNSMGPNVSTTPPNR
jgi:hypothetical protein